MIMGPVRGEPVPFQTYAGVPSTATGELDPGNKKEKMLKTKAKPKKKDVSAVDNPTEPPFEVMVVGDRCWGSGSTIAGARRVARRNGGSNSVHKYSVYIVAPGTTLDEAANFVYPAGAFAPIEIDRVGLGFQ